MPPAADDSASRNKENLKRLSKFSGTEIAAELMSRLSFIDALRALIESNAASMSLVSLDEMIEILKETLIWGASLTSGPHRNLNTRNPDIIVGETNVSNNKTVAGTVESRTKNLGPKIQFFDTNKDVTEILDIFFGMMVVLQTGLRENGQLDNEAVTSILRSLRSWNFSFKKEKLPTDSSTAKVVDVKVKEDTNSSTNSSVQSQLATIRVLKAEKNFLAYRLRKSASKQPKQHFSRKPETRRQ